MMSTLESIEVLVDALGEECSAYFFAFCFGTEMCPRHPWLQLGFTDDAGRPCCRCQTSPTNMWTCDHDLDRIRHNDDVGTGVSLAERRARLGECMEVQLRKRARLVAEEEA